MIVHDDNIFEDIIMLRLEETPVTQHMKLELWGELQL